MTWLNSGSWVTIGVILFLCFIVARAAAKFLPGLVRSLLAKQDLVERYGWAGRAFKYQRLVPWVDRIPISADQMTWLRLGLVGGSLLCFRFQLDPYILPLYIIGWLTDYTDGLKAGAEERRRGRPTRHGKYLDPTIDLICFTLMAVVLGPYYPRRLLIAFAVAIGARVLLFAVILVGRLCRPTWRRRLSSNILPKTITGEAKAAFIAVSFGLIMFSRTDPTNLFWAGRLLTMAIVLEGFSLTHLARQAWRSIYGRPQLSIVPADDRTG
ncbi:MAG: CDP-alcohol phosphatidyltransferase family protein [Patescibacteria group bacterium]